MSQNRTDKAKLCTAIVFLVLNLAHPNLSCGILSNPRANWAHFFFRIGCDPLKEDARTLASFPNLFHVDLYGAFLA